MDEAACKQMRVSASRYKYQHLPETPIYQREDGLNSLRSDIDNHAKTAIATDNK